MIKAIENILPEKMSDESVYCLVNFLMELALALESHYFSQIRRYNEDNAPSPTPWDLEKNPSNENDL